LAATVRPVKLATARVLFPAVVLPLEAAAVVVAADRAATAVAEVKLDHLDHQELPVAQVTQALQEHPVDPVARPSPSANNTSNPHASLALLDHLDLPAHLDHQETTEAMDNLATPALSHNPDLQDHLVNPDSPDNLDTPEDLDSQDSPDRANQLDPDSPVHQETKDHPDLQDNQAAQDSQEDLEPQDQKDHPDNQAHPETMDSLANPDKLDNLVAQERRVSAPNIVPSTVESSSRTELEDVNKDQESISISLPLSVSLWVLLSSNKDLCLSC